MKYGVALWDGYMGMVANGAYYTMFFDSEKEALEWCNKANKTEKTGTWRTRKIEEPDDNLQQTDTVFQQRTEVSMHKGKFIVFEGLDNTGKSTVSKIIAIMLDAMGIKCKLTRHPGSTDVGSELRQILKHSPHPINANAQALMFAADNSIFMDQVLKPALDEGTWVIGDRNNFISSMAYQIASGCDLEELDRVHDATKQTAKIDLVLIFDCPVEQRLKRRQLREQMEGKPTFDRFEDTDMEYQRKLSACYKGVKDDTARLSKFMHDTSKVVIIDASQELDQVIAAVKEVILTELLPAKSALASAG